MTFADSMRETAIKAIKEKELALLSETQRKNIEWERAKIQGNEDADKSLMGIQVTIAKEAAKGEFSLKYLVGEGDSANHPTSNAFVIGKSDRLKQLLSENGFSVKENITTNGYDYDDDGCSHGHHSWHYLEISWRRD